MPSLKIAVRSDEINKSGQCRIKIRLSHRGNTRYISTNPAYYIDPALVKDTGEISHKYASASKLNLRLNEIIQGYQKKIIELGDEVNNLSAQQVKEYLEATAPDLDFFAYAANVISNLQLRGHNSTAKSYAYTIEHLKCALDKDNLPFSMFSVDTLRQFEVYMLTKTDRPNKINSVAVHLRNIRAIINRAINDGTTGQENYPFRRHKIKTEETPIHYLSIETLRKFIAIRDLIPGHGRFIDPLHRTADIFLLSFYLIGINPADLSRLKKENLVNGRIQYRRAKTGRLISIKVEPEAMEIINRYPGEEYLLNLMENKPVRKADRKTELHTDFKRNANKNLQKLAGILDIPEKVVMTSARYSWATMAAGLNISDSIIGRALGHQSPFKLVPVYTMYDISQVDHANRHVIDKLLGKQKRQRKSPK